MYTCALTYYAQIHADSERIRAVEAILATAVGHGTQVIFITSRNNVAPFTRRASIGVQLPLHHNRCSVTSTFVSRSSLSLRTISSVGEIGV